MVVVAAGRDEGGAGAAGGHLEAQHAAVEIERPLQVGDLQVDVADADAGVDGRGSAGPFFSGFGWTWGLSSGWPGAALIPTCKHAAPFG